MRARIVEVDEFNLVLKDERKRFLTVDKKRLKFGYKLGDTVEVERGSDGKLKFRVYGGNEPLTGSAFPVRPSVHRVGVKQKKAAEEPFSVGLWIILGASILTLIWQLYAIVHFHPLVDAQTCRMLNQSFNGSCAPHSAMLMVELTAMIILAMLNIGGIVSLITRQRIARRIISITCVAAVVWVAIDWLCYGAINTIHSLPESIITSVDLRSIGWIILMAIVSGIVIPYLYKSDRVRRALNKK